MAIGCLAGYALARYRGGLGFWLLIAALVFRAMPHVVLLTAYRPAFFDLGIWSRYETLIVVLVAINQPFTIWLMRAFFLTIPPELDEAAMVDGCSRWGAFVRVILPVAGTRHRHRGAVLVPAGLQRLPDLVAAHERRHGHDDRGARQLHGTEPVGDQAHARHRRGGSS